MNGPAEQWVKRDSQVVWHGFTQMSCYADNDPIVVERAEGHYLIDVNGERYLDAISSLWVSTMGHRVPELDAALVDQVGRVAHSTLLGNGNTAVVELAEALADVVPVDGPHFVFASDGAASVEQALKICFQYWVNKGVEGRIGYLALGDAYHGDTLGALSVGAGGFGTDLFDPLRFPVLRAPGYADPSWCEAAIDAVSEHRDELAAAVVEPLVQGAGGMLVCEPSDLARFAAHCRRNGVLVVADEVATGFGRTGTLFASEQCDLRPDVLCLGKGITGGYLPLSATVVSQELFDAFLGEDLGPRTFYHGHSYGGNALGAAVALRHLALLRERDVLENVLQRSAQLDASLHDLFDDCEAVTDIRLRGLMCGIELAPPAPGMRWGRSVCGASVRRGVLLRPLGDVIVVFPPLTVTEDEINRIVDVLADSIDEVCAQ
jgi:adenosylmethionine---8-amino-7-oxononanoate aminotransferase